MRKPFFKVGEKVWDDSGNELIVKKVEYKHLVNIYMYSFENTTICMGEMYLRNNPNEKPIGMKKGFVKTEKEMDEVIPKVVFKDKKVSLDCTPSLEGNIFFRPDNVMLDWLVEYAGDRIIVDVGAGSFWLSKELSKRKAHVLAVEPYPLDLSGTLTSELKMVYNINYMPWEVERCKDMFFKLGKKALFIYARPCHSDFVEKGISYVDKGVESLYITVPENLELYDDLGEFRHIAKEIKPKGTSLDNEVIYSIVKK